MSKTRKYIPEIRIRKPYRREPKLRVNMPVDEPFDAFHQIEEEDDLDDETDQYTGHSDSQD